MYISDLTVWLQVIAAIGSAIAAIFSARATIIGPMKAAELSEKLKNESLVISANRDFRLYVFKELMQERGTLGSPASTRALNLVDIAFVENRAVRDALSELYMALRSADIGLKNDKTIRLLNVMSADLGLSEKLTPSDIDRVFSPGR